MKDWLDFETARFPRVLCIRLSNPQPRCRFRLAYPEQELDVAVEDLERPLRRESVHRGSTQFEILQLLSW